MNLGNSSIPLLRTLVEISLITMLIFAVLLMAEFTRAAGQGKTLALAFQDVLTLTNFTFAIISALVGSLVFSYLRRQG